MNLAVKALGVLTITTWTLFTVFWLAAIWTTGNDPLSIKLGYTACVMLFFAIISSIAWPVVADEARNR